MKKIWILAFFLLSDLFGQVDPTRFAKIGFADLYWLQMRSIYNMSTGFCNFQSNSYYYPALKSLGLNYVVSMADVETNLNSTYNDSIKVIDMYFRSLVYSNVPRYNSGYRSTVFAYSDGNAPDYFPYEAGGANQANPADSLNNYYFGGLKQGTWYYSPYLLTGDATIGDRNADDSDGETPIKTVYAGIEDDEPGYLLCAVISPGYMDTYHAGHDYYLDIRTRINQISGQQGTDTVAIIYLTETSSTGVVVRRGRLWEGLPENEPELSATTPSSMVIRASDYTTGNNYLNIKKLFTKAKDTTYQNIKIYWTKKRDMYIDNISVYNKNYDSLFVSNATTRAATETKITNELNNNFGAVKTNPLWAHLYHDEPDPLANRSVKKISDLAVTNLGAGKYVNGANYTINNVELHVANKLRRMPYVLYDYYPLTGNTDSSSTGINNVQNALDILINNSWTSGGTDYNCGMRAMINLAQNYTPNDPSDDVPFYHTMQACAEKTLTAGAITDIMHREPQPSEILTQGWLAMCYGAKGLMYYTIATNTAESTGAVIHGLFDSQGQIDYPCQDPRLQQIPNARYYAVQKLNGQIDNISSELMQLTWVDAFSAHQGIPSGKYVTNVSYPVTPNDAKYIEVGFFKKSDDMANDNLEYLMVVNRRVLSSETKLITIQLNKSSSPYNNWKVTEVGQTTPCAYITKSGTFTYSFPPGEGRLFRIEPVLIAGGNLNYNDTITTAHTALLPANLTVQPSATLTISPGVTLHYPDTTSMLSVFGTLQLKSDMTIPAGATLCISSTASNAGKLYIDSNKTVTIHGTFSAQGSSAQKVTIDRIGNIGSWTIAYDSSYNIPAASYTNSISWANIKHCCLIKIIRSDASISDCAIDSCIYGIWIQYSSPQIIGNDIRPIHTAIYGLGATSPFIYNNNIHREESGYGSVGIELFSNMYPFVAKNRITGFYIGMCFEGNAVSYLTNNDCIPPNPNNKLIGNYEGLRLANGAMCEAGDGDFLGYNSISGNINDVYCTNYSALFAVGDYWGGGDLVNYYCDSSSYIWAPLPLDADPWDNEQLVRPTENAPVATILKKVNADDIASNFKRGLQLERESKIDQAIEHYKNMVAKDMATGSALTKLVQLTRKNKSNDIGFYLTELMNSSMDKKDEVMNLLANLTLQDGDYAGAMKLYDKVIEEYPKNITATFAMVDKLFATLHVEKNEEKAALLLSELQGMDITDPGLLSLLQSANMSIYGEDAAYNQRNKALNKTNTVTSLPKEYSLSNNYPNPFNPVTSISYELPKDGYVSLVVYDVLGKVVKSLVNEQKQAGRYTATFNAANLPSGIYFYTLKTGSFDSTKKMLLIK